MKRSYLKRKPTSTTRAHAQFHGSFKKAPRIVKVTRKKKRDPDSISSLKKRLWALCREITRKQYGNTCFTCGKTGLEGSSWQTGHFIAKSVCSTELAYSLDNLRIQCYNCNINKSGNWIEFEARLGAELAQGLKEKNRATKGKPYHSDWFKEKITQYQELLKDNDYRFNP